MHDSPLGRRGPLHPHCPISITPCGAILQLSAAFSHRRAYGGSLNLGKVMFATAPVGFHRSAHAGVPAVTGTEVSSSLRKPATIAGIRRPFATSWTTCLHAVHEVGSRDLDERSDLPGFQSRRIVLINSLGRLDANADIIIKLPPRKEMYARTLKPTLAYFASRDPFVTSSLCAAKAANTSDFSF